MGWSLSRRWQAWVVLAFLLLTHITSAREPVFTGRQSELDRIPADASILLSIYVADLWKSKACQLLRQQPETKELLADLPTQMSPKTIERMTLFSLPEGVTFLLHMKHDLNPVTVGKQILPNGKLRTIAGYSMLVDESNWLGLLFLDATTFAMGPVDSLTHLVERQKQDAGPLSLAIEMARSGRQLVLAVNPKRLPREARNACTQSNNDSLQALLLAQTVILGLDLSTHLLSAQLELNYGTDSQAIHGEKSLEQLKDASAIVGQIGNHPNNPYQTDTRVAASLQQFCQAAESGLRHLKVTREHHHVRADLFIKADDSGMLLGLLPQGMDLLFELFLKPNDTNLNPDRMARIGVALMEYHRKNGRLPGAAICNADGKAMLSWRVALLPYLGQGDLYKEFNLDEPWDSTHNLKLLSHMPSFYSADGTSAPTTRFQAITGKGTAFEGQKAMRLKDLKDGPEQTILIAEGARCVPWTKPEDLVVHSSKPLPELVAGTAGAILGDGKMVLLPLLGQVGPTVPRGVTENHLRALMTRNSADRVEAAAVLALTMRPEDRGQYGIGMPPPPYSPIQSVGHISGPRPIPEVLPMPTLVSGPLGQPMILPPAVRMSGGITPLNGMGYLMPIPNLMSPGVIGPPSPQPEIDQPH